ncbi:EpsG family protein [Microbacterium alcoholitolerans]|uniref:EpsG family protein n=1 Tax=unclassified Microbacterium TaxID=2609290 RepID=UPI003D182192
MIVYPLVFLAATLFASWGDRRAQRRDGGVSLPRRLTLGAVLVIAVLAGVSALRWRVGTDYWTYEYAYDAYVEQLPDKLSLMGEPGLRLLAWLSNVVGTGSAGMFGLAAIITITLMVRTLWRWSPAFAFSVAILIVSGVWHGSFNGVRQYLACAILFAGHRYIIDRKPFRWFVVVLVAMLFHVSALVALLMYFVPTKRTSIPIQAAVFALGVVGMVSFTEILELIGAFVGDDGVADGIYANRSVSPLRIAFAFVPIALFWILRNNAAVTNANAWFYVNMLTIYAATYLASANSAYIARFAIYVAPFLALGLVSITAVPNQRERAFIRGALLCLYATFMYIQIVDTSNLSNFQWIFERE